MKNLKLKELILLSAFCLSALLFSGCGPENTAKWNAGCHVFLAQLPPEYEQLSPEIKNAVTISITLRHTTSDKKFRAKLTDANHYSADLALLPGSYEIASLYMSDKNLAMFDVTTDLKTIDIRKDEKMELPLTLTDPEGFAASVLRNQASAEILALEPYSRKVQYNGQILDLTAIPQIMQFSVLENKMLKPAETYDIASSSHAGVAMVVQNQSSSLAALKDAQFIGVRFRSNQVILPRGIRLGMSLAEIAHKETGILGTPAYCQGSPLIGTGHDKTTLVYLDSVSGDRISLTVGAEDNFIGSILYEFERYE